MELFEFSDRGFEEFEATVGGAGGAGGVEVLGDVAQFGQEVEDGAGWVADPGEVLAKVDEIGDAIATLQGLGGDADDRAVHVFLAGGVAAKVGELLAGNVRVLVVGFD